MGRLFIIEGLPCMEKTGGIPENVKKAVKERGGWLSLQRDYKRAYDEIEKNLI